MHVVKVLANYLTYLIDTRRIHAIKSLLYGRFTTMHDVTNTRGTVPQIIWHHILFYTRTLVEHVINDLLNSLGDLQPHIRLSVLTEHFDRSDPRLDFLQDLVQVITSDACEVFIESHRL